MALHKNLIVLRGNMATPEIFDARGDNDDIVTRFGLATTKRWKDKATGEPREVTQWHTITAFRQTAKYVRDYAPKGSLVEVTGELVYEQYTGDDGVERTSAKIMAREVDVIIKGDSNVAEHPSSNSQKTTTRAPQQAQPAAAQSGGAAQAAVGDSNPFDFPDDEIPF